MRVSREVFNPANGDSVNLEYLLERGDAITVRVSDSDGEVIRVLATASSREPGSQVEVWDGRDWEGKPVPDEAYTFTIEMASGALYDPFGFPAAVGDITDADFQREAGTVTYALAHPARVLGRIGIHSGPLLKTLVDWKPRMKGSLTEYWNGRDEDNVSEVWGHKDLAVLLTYVSLPPSTVISFGNGYETYREYKLGRGRNRPKVPRLLEGSQSGRRVQGLIPPAWARAPRVLITFPGVVHVRDPEVSGVLDVRIDIDDSDRPYLLSDQFEIILFVDNVFFAEAERGHVPYNWTWELSQLPPGDHILTVNISSFKGQVGVASRKVRVVKGGQ